MNQKKWKKGLIVAIAILALLGIGGTLYIKSNTYQPETAAVTASESAQKDGGVLYFEGDPDKPTLLFYQGALVENESYSIWAQKVAAAGYSVYLLKQPFNLAVLGQNDAGKIIQAENIGAYVIGGHSLGGVMGSRFAHQHLSDEHLKGVLFMASYPDEKGSLSTFKGSVLSITASKDGVLNQDKYTQAKEFLPASTEYEVIQGGNHAGFGSYGQQKGDRQPDINVTEQQQQISDAVIQWLSAL